MCIGKKIIRMSNPDVEGMLLEMESEIFTLKLDDVVKLANDMKLDGFSIKDKSLLRLNRSLQKKRKLLI